MRNFLLAALTALALCGAGVGEAVGQISNDSKNRWMTVKNDSAFDAVSIHIIPSKSSCCWSRDLLGDEIVPANPKKASERPTKGRVSDLPTVIVNFDDGSGACKVDIRITTRHPGWAWLFDSIEVCDPSIRSITLVGDPPVSSSEKNDKKKNPKTANRWIVVQNFSKLREQQIFIIPSWQDETAKEKKREDCCWSRDLHPMSGPVGRKGRLVNFDDGSGNCWFDIRITSDKKGTDWYLDGVNVCRVARLILKDREDAKGDTKGDTKGDAKGDTKVRVVTIKNESRFLAITAHAKAKKEGPWSDDLLGVKIIPSGESLEVDFDDGTGACELEYRITKSDGGQWDGKINACSEPPAKLPAILLK